jgi:hypothetical protein
MDCVRRLNCEDCGAVFEYYCFSVVAPTKCYGCQRKERGTRRYNSKIKKEEVVEDKKEVVEKSVIGFDIGTLVYKCIPGVSKELLLKYKDIRKLTRILNKKT